MSETVLNADAQALAEKAAAAMWQRDAAAQSLGMKLEEIRPAYARMSMMVRSDMVNGHHICHGGMIFTLADTAFAYACNSYNLNTVASACQIDFIRPGMEGELLMAEAKERSLSRRSGVYDVAITNPQGKTIALFRGKSSRIGGEVSDTL